MATVEERHPELFRPVSTESPRGKKRTVPMEVLCLGFPRTGTSSMCAALEKLGIRCWHSTCFLSTNFADIEMWQEAVDRKFFPSSPSAYAANPVGRAEFDQLLHSHGAVSSDTPAVAFAEELVAAYPDAKVVLVEREVESWYVSFRRGVLGNMFDPLVNVIYQLDRFYVHPIGKIHKTVVDGWLGVRSLEDADRVARERYREHYELVRRITPKERLLEFDLKDGWAPLCEFLGKPVPKEPFPHLNERLWLDEKVRLVVVNGAKSVARKAALPVAALVVAGFAWWWR
ncbi:nad dependent epimerase [Colletotrichum plurivorum]|uniref:Nad dependent epimerase n=1 Tax=Colletotrichum plurivorum TaxID=2175906 RepID=A0A8H6NBY2_9PEZI|nr:nad dependent epimerase [Colletotrichum plurivorum]